VPGQGGVHQIAVGDGEIEAVALHPLEKILHVERLRRLLDLEARVPPSQLLRSLPEGAGALHHGASARQIAELGQRVVVGARHQLLVHEGDGGGEGHSLPPLGGGGQILDHQVAPSLEQGRDQSVELLQGHEARLEPQIPGHGRRLLEPGVLGRAGSGQEARVAPLMQDPQLTVLPDSGEIDGVELLRHRLFDAGLRGGLATRRESECNRNQQPRGGSAPAGDRVEELHGIDLSVGRGWLSEGPVARLRVASWPWSRYGRSPLVVSHGHQSLYRHRMSSAVEGKRRSRRSGALETSGATARGSG
jgi:hypothetical protein